MELLMVYFFLKVHCSIFLSFVLLERIQLQGMGFDPELELLPRGVLQALPVFASVSARFSSFLRTLRSGFAVLCVRCVEGGLSTRYSCFMSRVLQDKNDY